MQLNWFRRLVPRCLYPWGGVSHLGQHHFLRQSNTNGSRLATDIKEPHVRPRAFKNPVLSAAQAGSRLCCQSFAKRSYKRSSGISSFVAEAFS